MARIPINISTPNDGNGDPLRTAFDYVNTMFTELYNDVVFKEAGKGLSTNNFDDAAVTKLSGIAAGAEVNVQADLTQEDDLQDDFVKGKNILVTASPVIMDGFTGVTAGFAVGQQDYTLPLGAVVIDVCINDGKQVKTTLTNAARLNRWSQTDNILSITKSPVLNNYIYIEFIQT